MADHERNGPVFSEATAAAKLGMTKRMLADRRRAGKIDYLKEGDYIGYYQRHLDEFCAKIERINAEPKSSRGGVRLSLGPVKTRGRVKTQRSTGWAAEHEAWLRRNAKRYGKQGIDPLNSLIFGGNQNDTKQDGVTKTHEADMGQADSGGADI